MIPIWGLYEIKSLDEALFTKNSSDCLKDSNNLEERTKIYEALTWAAGNPDFDFKEIMSEAPVRGSLNFSNAEVYQYLMMFKSFMESDEFDLLIDDRPPKEF